MKLLLDTHFVLWIVTDGGKMKAKEKKALLDPANEIYCSSLSFWEISLKVGLGKLQLEGVAPEAIPALLEANGYKIATVSPEVMASAHQLPRGAHKDPFDRLLVWQAMQEGYTLMSRDGKLGEYEGSGLKLFE